MYLSYRDARPEDVPLALPLFQDRLPHLKGQLVPFQGLLQQLIATKMAPSIVVEDQDRPAGDRVVGLSLGFFANEPFHTFVHDRQRPPLLALHAIDWWSKGRSVDVHPDAYHEEQSTQGGNLVFLVKGVDSLRHQGQDLNRIREHASIAFVKCLYTFRIRTFADEVYGQEELARLRSFGMELYNDFGGPDVSGNPSTHPYFVGINTQTLRENPTQTPTIAQRYSLLPQPRFGFTLREQEILRRAMVGNTDREIADSLGLSLIGIKKRWEAIYARVEGFDHLLPDIATDAEQDQPKQKRRALMQLLAEHPEELWRNKKIRDVEKGAVRT
jgi:DNA-binding CsgD family transcriptional regulator